MSWVIAVQRLEQPDGGDLLEVLERNPLAAIDASRDRVGKRQVAADQAFGGPRSAVVGVGAEICCLTLAVIRGVCERRSRSGRLVTRHPLTPRFPRSAGEDSPVRYLWRPPRQRHGSTGSKASPDHSRAFRRIDTRCRVTPKRSAICSIVRPSA